MAAKVRSPLEAYVPYKFSQVNVYVNVLSVSIKLIDKTVYSVTLHFEYA